MYYNKINNYYFLKLFFNNNYKYFNYFYNRWVVAGKADGWSPVSQMKGCRSDT